LSIQSDPESVEQIRERLRKMSDLELRKFGSAARNMADPTKNFGTLNPAFKVQLRIRRRADRAARTSFLAAYFLVIATTA
jgi:hypothetical protein